MMDILNVLYRVGDLQEKQIEIKIVIVGNLNDNGRTLQCLCVKQIIYKELRYLPPSHVNSFAEVQSLLVKLPFVLARQWCLLGFPSSVCIKLFCKSKRYDNLLFFRLEHYQEYALLSGLCYTYIFHLKIRVWDTRFIVLSTWCK